MSKKQWRSAVLDEMLRTRLWKGVSLIWMTAHLLVFPLCIGGVLGYRDLLFPVACVVVTVLVATFAAIEIRIEVGIRQARKVMG
jgi:hypothetical protein